MYKLKRFHVPPMTLPSQHLDISRIFPPIVVYWLTDGKKHQADLRHLAVRSQVRAPVVFPSPAVVRLEVDQRRTRAGMVSVF